VILGKFWSKNDLRHHRNWKFLGDDQGCLSERTVHPQPRCLLVSRTVAYCILGCEEINAWLARGAAARVSVNFRKFSPCIARARRAPAGLAVYPPSRTLELLAFFCFLYLILLSLCLQSKPRSIRCKKAEVSKRQYSSTAKSSNVREGG
jgi:hypothetical protein